MRVVETAGKASVVQAAQVDFAGVGWEPGMERTESAVAAGTATEVQATQAESVEVHSASCCCASAVRSEPQRYGFAWPGYVSVDAYPAQAGDVALAALGDPAVSMAEI